jgi:hypothetical protein
MELELKNYRSAMVSGSYQAQINCPECQKPVLTKNLEVYKVDDGEDENGVKLQVREAEATDVVCMDSNCGHQIGTVVFKRFPYSAPVKWRK